MTVTIEQNDDSIVCKIEGRIDTVTSPDLEAEIKKNAESAQSITLDFEKVEYISSAGLRVLLSAHKMMAKKGGLHITHVSSSVNDIFDVTGFSDILNID